MGRTQNPTPDEGVTMARTTNRLSDRTVWTVNAPDLHADGGNLFLAVDPPRRAADGTAGPAARFLFNKVLHRRGR
jgi:hypothetical protein